MLMLLFICTVYDVPCFRGFKARQLHDNAAIREVGPRGYRGLP